MNLAIFGGTFDPIHRGHIAIARAAAERFQLKKVLFVPADLPPHKTAKPITPFAHRFAMVTLATQDHKDFSPSLLEMLAPGRDPVINYSIETVRRVKKTLRAADKLYFLTGVDAFLKIATWREPEALLREVQFIVASRPGFSLGQVGEALPHSMRPPAGVTKAARKQPAEGTIALPGGAVIHLMSGLTDKATATDIRAAAAGGRSVLRLVDPRVADYIKKMQLYRGAQHQLPARGREGKVLSFQSGTQNRKKEAR